MCLTLIMAWTNQIQDATYTSPSGKIFSFKYSSGINRETDLKTSTFTFPEKDGALVVPMGIGGKRFPLTCTFHGENCFDEADAFEAGLCEKGYGELQHPVYGIHKVVPTGTIKRSDDVVNGLNQSVVEITFSETIIDESFPDSQILKVDEIMSEADKFESIAMDYYVDVVDVKNLKPKDAISAGLSLKDNAKTIFDNTISPYKKFSDFYSKADQIYTELLDCCDKYVNKAAQAAILAIKLIRLPSTLTIKTIDKVNGYMATAKAIISNFRNDPFNTTGIKNAVATSRMLLQSIVVATASGVAVTSAQGNDSSFMDSNNTYNDNATFRSRDEAEIAVQQIIELYNSNVEFIDNNTAKNVDVDDDKGFGIMRDITIHSVEAILNFSFTLQSKKIITLGRDRQLWELLAELYGNFDNADEFIIDNKLNADEIQLIPMGRKVIYYV